MLVCFVEWPDRRGRRNRYGGLEPSAAARATLGGAGSAARRRPGPATPGPRSGSAPESRSTS